MLPVTRLVIDRAVDLARHRRLRGYDAVQLASGLLANETLTGEGRPTLVFVASDTNLLIAARAEGMTTENPLDHADPTAG